MQWCLLKEEDVIPRIRAMEGRRGEDHQIQIDSEQERNPG